MTTYKEGELLRVKKTFKMYRNDDKSEIWIQPNTLYRVIYAEHFKETGSSYYELGGVPITKNSVCLQLYNDPEHEMVDWYFDRCEE